MLKLFDPVIFTADEQAFINSKLKPLGKDSWANTEPETKKIKHHIQTINLNT